MVTEQKSVLEIKLKRITIFALCMQGLWLSMLIGLSLLGPNFYPNSECILCLAALLSSFAISKFYIQQGKKLEELKTFSSEEKETT